jgi:hypothetical protein
MKRVKLCLLLALSVIVWAGGAPARSAAAQPASGEALVGLYITQLYDLDMVKRAFSVTFWGWQVHSSPDYRPLETLEIFNAKSVTQKYASNEQKGERQWSQAKYSAVMMQDWDVTHYPFDRQKLNIVFEDGQFDADKIKLIADKADSKIDGGVSVPGWVIEGLDIRDEEIGYQTTYGDPDLHGSSVYSRVTATVTLKREGWRMLASLYVGFFVAFTLTFLTYFLDPRELVISRIGLCAGAIFAAVGNKYVIDNLLPPASGFTLSDMIELTTFVAIILSIVVVALMEAVKHAKPTWPMRINYIAAALNFSAYVGLNGGTIMAAAG